MAVACGIGKFWVSDTKADMFVISRVSTMGGMWHKYGPLVSFCNDYVLEWL